MSENPFSKQSTSRKLKFDLKVPRELAESLVASGLRPADIARRYGYSAATVYDYLKKWGIDWSANVKHRLEDMCSRDELLSLIETEGLSQGQIAVRYEVTSQVVCRLIRKYGIQLDSSAKYVSKTSSRLARKKAFSLKQRSVVVGSILGDGHLRIPSGGVNATLQYGHCVRQRPYLAWKLDVLSDFSTGNIYEDIAQGACRAATMCHPEFTRMLQLFYVNGRKIVPESIGDFLDPLVLAVWYMDDGYTARYSSIFHTNSFSISDHERLLSTPILSRLGARLGRISSNGKKYPMIVCYGNSHRDLHQLIDPLILDLFAYKKHSGSSETIREAPSVEG